MANNRMALVCTECGEGKCIAKYYPSTGWYPVGDQTELELEKWMDTHRHDKFTHDGHGQWRLGFESDGMKDWHYVGDPTNWWSGVAASRDAIVDAISSVTAKEPDNE